MRLQWGFQICHRCVLRVLSYYSDLSDTNILIIPLEHNLTTFLEKFPPAAPLKDCVNS